MTEEELWRFVTDNHAFDGEAAKHADFQRVVECMDVGELPGLEQWQDAVREHAIENPPEVYEWWRVTPWLAEKLREIGEPVLENGYGCWYGRACTGQALIMDGTLQRIASTLFPTA